MFKKENIYIMEKTNEEIDINDICDDKLEQEIIEQLSPCMVYEGKDLNKLFKLKEQKEEKSNYKTFILRQEIIEYAKKKMNQWINGLLL